MIMIIQKVYEYLFILPCICIAFTINQGNNRQQSVYIVFQEAFHASILETISARDTKVGTLAKYFIVYCYFNLVMASQTCSQFDHFEYSEKYQSMIFLLIFHYCRGAPSRVSNIRCSPYLELLVGQAAVTLICLRLFRSLPQTSFLPLSSYDGLFLLLLVLAQAFFGKTKINKKLNDVSRVNTHSHSHSHIESATHTYKQ